LRLEHTGRDLKRYSEFYLFQSQMRLDYEYIPLILVLPAEGISGSSSLQTLRIAYLCKFYTIMGAGRGLARTASVVPLWANCGILEWPLDCV